MSSTKNKSVMDYVANSKTFQQLATAWGLTATAAELNALAGLGITATNFNALSGITGTQVAQIALINATLTGTTMNYAIAGYAQNLKFVTGSGACTANSGTIVPNGANTIYAFGYGNVCATKPVAGKYMCAKKHSATAFVIYRWKATGPSTCTATAASAGGTYNWWALTTN